MTDLIINISITIATFLFMEFVAWFTHKYVMHGFLWEIHEIITNPITNIHSEKMTSSS